MKKTKPPKETTAGRISQARLTRLTRQNEKREIEVQRLRGEVGPIETFKQIVLKANAVVKLQVLAVPIRESPALGLTPEQIAALNRALTDSLNDLAFNDELKLQPDVCPTCGKKTREEVAL